MANVPTWIIDQVRFKSFDFSTQLPNIKKSFNLEKNRANPLRLESKHHRHGRNASVLDRPSNPLIFQLEFNERCKNFWSKFESKAFPVLEKSSLERFQKAKGRERVLGRFNRIIKQNKKARDKTYRNDIHDQSLEADFGIQCELSSESSEIGLDMNLFLNLKSPKYKL